MDDRKWYQGFGNIFTILSFFTFVWPVSIVIMWLLADWSRKVKKYISFFLLTPFPVYYFGLFASHPDFGINPYQFVTSMGFTLRYSVFVIPFLSLILLVYYIFAKIQDNIEINKRLISWMLWFVYGIVIADIFIMGFLYNVVRW